MKTNIFFLFCLIIISCTKDEIEKLLFCKDKYTIGFGTINGECNYYFPPNTESFNFEQISEMIENCKKDEN